MSTTQSIPRDSLTAAEEAIHHAAMLSANPRHAWVMGRGKADQFAASIGRGFEVRQGQGRGFLGEPLFVVTDGHWYVS